MQKKINLLALLFSFYMSNAQNLFKDDFSTYNVAQLSGQGTWTNNSSSFGGGNCFGLDCATKVQNNNITYLNYGTSNKTVELKVNADACGSGFTPVGNGDLYVGLVINLSATTTSTNDFFRVLSGGAFSTTFRLSAKTDIGGFVIGVTKGGTPVYTTNVLPYNQDHLIVLKYSIVSGTNNDVVSAYVNPIFTNGQPIVADVQVGSGTDTTGNIDRLMFRQNATGIPTGRAGLVSVAKTWADLSFFPLFTNTFEKSTFSIISNDIKSGFLSIKSNINLEKASVKIFDIQGRNLENKEISLSQNINKISVNPIANTGIYIIEISGENKKFTQKIIIQ